MSDTTDRIKRITIYPLTPVAMGASRDVFSVMVRRVNARGQPIRKEQIYGVSNGVPGLLELIKDLCRQLTPKVGN